jgi:hypothetical protein
MVEALKVREIDGVLVWKLDRLSRQQRNLAQVLAACEKHKAFVASVTEPINTSEIMGQFVAEMLVAQARTESANTSIRQKRKAKEQLQQGLPPSNGKRCFGYDRKYTSVVEEEAALLREVRDRLFAGESLRSVCFDFEKRNIRGTQGTCGEPTSFNASSCRQRPPLTESSMGHCIQAHGRLSLASTTRCACARCSRAVLPQSGKVRRESTC